LIAWDRASVHPPTRVNITDISQIAFKSKAIILKLRRRCNGFPSAAVQQPDFGELSVPGRPFSHFSAIQAYLSALFTSLSIPSTYAGTGLRRRSSIRPEIFWNKRLGTATSAN
jgi:hypothetical protein